VVIRAHFAFVLLASLALAAAAVAWLFALPDGSGDTLRREPHVFAELACAAVAGVGLYLAVVLPVVLHALAPRWPFRVFLVPSVAFGLLNLGPLFHSVQYASEPTGSVYEGLWAAMPMAGFLVLYLLVAACVFGWVLLPQASGPRSATKTT
jgi:hypothetical protein